ncbi:MAG: hypothetical protein V5A28_08665, partial [Haloarculaceae archaeon]
TSESEDPLRRTREKNGIISAYAQTVLFYEQGKISGKAPTGLRILEVNNTNQPPKTFYVNNSVALEFGSGQIDAPEYEQRVYRTLRNQTAHEKQRTIEIDRKGDDYIFYPNGTSERIDDD